MPRLDIPTTVAEVLDDSAVFEPNCLRAIKAFARSKPFAGTQSEREEKYRAVHAALCAAYSIDPAPRLVFEPTVQGACFRPETNTLALGKLSAITYLHNFALIRGMSPRQCFRWS